MSTMSFADNVRRYGELVLREDVCCKQGIFTFMVYKLEGKYYFMKMHNGEVKRCECLI